MLPGMVPGEGGLDRQQEGLAAGRASRLRGRRRPGWGRKAVAMAGGPEAGRPETWSAEVLSQNLLPHLACRLLVTLAPRLRCNSVCASPPPPGPGVETAQPAKGTEMETEGVKRPQATSMLTPNCLSSFQLTS